MPARRSSDEDVDEAEEPVLFLLLPPLEDDFDLFDFLDRSLDANFEGVVAADAESIDKPIEDSPLRRPVVSSLLLMMVAVVVGLVVLFAVDSAT